MRVNYRYYLFFTSDKSYSLLDKSYLYEGSIRKNLIS